MDDVAAREAEAQLALWGEEVKIREARLVVPGLEPRFEAILHVDELRVMLVTARARFEALQAGPNGHRIQLTDEFDQAWQELAAAIDRRMPRPRAP